MRIAVVTCADYRDCWNAFAVLFRKFWPDCSCPLWLVTDYGTDTKYDEIFTYRGAGASSWCSRVAAFASLETDPILLFLEDFFLTGPVQPELVERGLELLREKDAGCVRLYPCPGSDTDIGDPHFGSVSTAKGTSEAASYRISTMPAIWNPAYLRSICLSLNPPHTTAWDFEVAGTKNSQLFSQPVLSFKRDVKPWPLEIMATGIWRGKWTKGAKLLFAQHGIPLESAREDM